MDKLVLKFFADVLYYKKIICHAELEAILDAKHPSDLDTITDRIMRGEFNVYKKGETYLGYNSSK
jgi:hypothetical protein